MLEIRRVSDLRAISQSDWDRLLRDCPDSTVFQSREWIASWWQVYGAPDTRLELHAAYHGDRLVGLAPLYSQPVPFSVLPGRELVFIGANHADYQVFPAANGSLHIVDALLDSVQARVEAGLSVRLAEVPQFSTLALCLRQRRSRELTGLRWISHTPCPRLRARDNAKGLSSALRKKSLRRHTKQLAALGPIEVQHLTEPSDILPLLPELFRQHINRWASTPHPSIFIAEDSRNFYRAMVESLSRAGRLVFCVLRAGPHLVALHLGLRSRDEFIWYKPAFNTEHKRLSPGEVLLKALIEYTQVGDYAALDFSRGNERFKSRFATTFDYNVSYEWIPSGWHRFALQATRELRNLLREAGSRTRRILEREPALPARTSAVPKPVNALLLDTGVKPGAAEALRRVLENLGCEVDVCQPPAFDESVACQTGTLEREGRLAELGTWIKARDDARKYELILPIGQALLLALEAAPLEEQVKRKMLLPPTTTVVAEIEALATAATHQGSEQGMSPRGHQTDAHPSTTVECLFDNGRMVWHYCSGDATAQREGVNAARLELARRNWHGLALIEFESQPKGGLRMARLVRGHGESRALTSGVAGFAAAMLAVAQGIPAGPQPDDGDAEPAAIRRTARTVERAVPIR